MWSDTSTGTGYKKGRIMPPDIRRIPRSYRQIFIARLLLKYVLRPLLISERIRNGM
jgi:hypothetical protein